MVFVDKYGWPVERIKGRPVTNCIQLLLHTRSIMRGKWDGYGIVRDENNFNEAFQLVYSQRVGIRGSSTNEDRYFGCLIMAIRQRCDSPYMPEGLCFANTTPNDMRKALLFYHSSKNGISTPMVAPG